MMPSLPLLASRWFSLICGLVATSLIGTACVHERVQGSTADANERYRAVVPYATEPGPLAKSGARRHRRRPVWISKDIQNLNLLLDILLILGSLDSRIRY
jgi:hypothetical protein